MSNRPTDTLAPGTANTVLQPSGWPQPKGYANGIKARGSLLFVGGMIVNGPDFSSDLVLRMYRISK